MHIKPKNDTILLRDPRSRRRIPSEGASVPNTSFWVRRVLDGDAVKTTAAAIAKAVAEKASPAAAPPSKAAPAPKVPKTLKPDDKKEQ